MCNKKGFSLLSFLLYLFSFSLISLFICQTITSLLFPLLAQTRICKALVRLHTASDLFVRDIKTANNKNSSWKLISAQALVWSIGDDDVGWNIEEGKLKRYTGQYKKGWRKQNVSIVADGIAGGKFLIEMRNNLIIGAEMILIPFINKEKIITCYAAIEGKNEKEASLL